MKRTPTDTILQVLEAFGEVEPKECLVLWIDEGGDICWSCTTDALTTKLGMLEVAKQIIIRQLGQTE